MEIYNCHIESETLKNYLIDDPILDWLNIYGVQFNFNLDDTNKEDLFNNFLKKQNKMYKDYLIEN